tara:strand:- start:196 stop:408 length:213 start_codon:yes stop_codon:yes gene_type:complete
LNFYNSGKKINDLKTGARTETTFGDARNAPASASSEFDACSGNDVQTRKAEIFITHSSMGMLPIGTGSTV